MFCVFCLILLKWELGMFEVDLRIEYLSGEMLVVEVEILGCSEKIIVFNVYICYFYMVNDGMVGVVIWICLM